VSKNGTENGNVKGNVNGNVNGNENGNINGSINGNLLPMTNIPTNGKVENTTSEPIPVGLIQLEDWPIQDASLSKFTV